MTAAHVTPLRTFCSQSVTFTTTSHQTVQFSKFKGKKKTQTKPSACVFTAVCVQPASERRGGPLISRFTESAQRFLGGGRDSEREGSKKSADNYPQL